MNNNDTFDPLILAERYANLVPIEKHFGYQYSYMITDRRGNEAGHVAFSRTNASYCRDDYPAPRRFFRNYVPIETWADFERDMERLKLPLQPNSQLS